MTGLKTTQVTAWDRVGAKNLRMHRVCRKRNFPLWMKTENPKQTVHMDRLPKSTSDLKTNDKQLKHIKLKQTEL